MGNFENQGNKGNEHKVLRNKNHLSDSDLHLKRPLIYPNETGSDLHIIGFKVQLNDNRALSFTLDKAKSKSADFITNLSGSSEPTSQQQLENEIEFPIGQESIYSLHQAARSEYKESEGRLKKSSAFELKIDTACLENKEFEVHIKSKNDQFCSSGISEQKCLNADENGYLANSVKITTGSDGCRSVKYLKEASTVFLNHTADVQSSNINLASLNIVNDDVLNRKSQEDVCGQSENAHAISIETQENQKEPARSDASHSSMIQKTIQKDKKTVFFPSQTETELLSAEKERILSAQNDKIEIIDAFLTRMECDMLTHNEKIETVDTLSKRKECDISTQNKKFEAANTHSTEKGYYISTQNEKIETIDTLLIGKESNATIKTENIETFTELNIYSRDEERIIDKFTKTEDLSNASCVVAGETTKSDENRALENYQSLHEHEILHDCIYKCCYHEDCENTLPKTILLGQNLQYLSSIPPVFKCEYCQCYSNKSCSEITKICAEKLKTDIHVQYCCRCAMDVKDIEDSSDLMNVTENLKDIDLKTSHLNALPLEKIIPHQFKKEIVKHFEPPKEKEKTLNHVKIFKSPLIEKAGIFLLPVEKNLNSFSLSKLCQSPIAINPIAITLIAKVVSENLVKEQLESNDKSCTNETFKGSDKNSEPIFGEKMVESMEKIEHLKSNPYYSHSEICPCKVCHSKVNTVYKKKNSVVLLRNLPHVCDKENGKLSRKQFRSKSPTITPTKFDYISKGDWKPSKHRKDECLGKKAQTTDATHIVKTFSEENFESFNQGFYDACEIVNNHILNLRPIDEDTVRKAVALLHKRWFEVVANKYSDVHEVRYYIQYFTEFSFNLLKTLFHSVDNNGNNCLHYAFVNSKFDLVDELLQNSFALELFNKGNKFGTTPLMTCTISQPIRLSEWAIIKKCFEVSNVDKQSTENGQTALMIAASIGFRKMVDLLLDAGANPNLQDKDGSTALMYAAEHGHVKCVKSLMKHKKCDPTIRDQDGETACSIALRNGHKNITVFIHMQALEKRRLTNKNAYSAKHFMRMNRKESARKKILP